MRRFTTSLVAIVAAATLGLCGTGLGEKVNPIFKEKNRQGWTMQSNGNGFTEQLDANDYSDHIAFTYNPNAYQGSVNLMKDRPANYQVKCELVVPLVE